MEMSLVEKILRMNRRPEVIISKELNKGLYVKAFLEDDYLYHTTSFSRLKRILKDGFLSSNPKHTNHRHLHEGMICFTTNPIRHLSNFPDFVWMLGDIQMDTYIKFPFSFLRERGVKPVFYNVERHDLKRISENTPYLLQHLTTEEKLKGEYGHLFRDYRYQTWISENEWRIKAEKLSLPDTAQVYVSSYYQRKICETLTDLPVFLWREVMQMKKAIREKRRKEKEHFRRLAMSLEQRIKHFQKEQSRYEKVYGKSEYIRMLKRYNEELEYLRGRAGIRK